MKQSSYTIHGRRNRWRENSLEGADENVSKKFDWYVIKKFGPYVGRYKGWTLVSVALMLLYTVLNLANPFLIGVAIDQFIGHNDLRGLAITGIVLIIVNVLMWQAQYWQVWSMSWAGQQILYNLSSDMFTHLQSLSLSFYDRTQIGRVMSRLQSDIDVLESMLSSGLLSMLGSLVSLVGIIIAMLAMNVTLALLSFTVLPIMFVIAAFWQRFAQRSFRRTRAAISVVNATLQENITGMRVIQSLAREERNRDEFDELNARLPQDNVAAAATVMLAVRGFEIALSTTRDVYLDGESFPLQVVTTDAQGNPIGESLSATLVKQVETEGRVTEREVTRQTLTTDTKTTTHAHFSNPGDACRNKGQAWCGATAPDTRRGGVPRCHIRLQS